MAINFPSSPSLNDTYAVGTKTWIWNGYAWDLVVASVAPAYDTANAAFDKANSANVLAYNTGIGANNYAGVMANAANAYAASLTPDLSPAFSKANDAYTVANAAFDKANSANVLAYDTGIGANNYAGVMANSVNSYTSATYSTLTQFGSVFGVANGAFDKANSANVLAYNTGIGANTYTNTSTSAANNYAGRMANSANAWANTVGTSGNAYAVVVGTSGNAYTVVVGASGNAYTNVSADAANNYAGVMANASNTYANSTFLKLTAPSQTITGDFSITGNLFIGGNTTAVSANNFIVNDPLIYLANNNPSDILDIGFVGSYVNTGSANVHTGLYRDHTSKQYYLFQGYDANPELTNEIAPYSNNMVNATLVADLITSNLTLGGANAIVWIKSNYDTLNAGYTVANAAFDKANSANVLAYNTGIGANAYINSVAISINSHVNTSINTSTNSAYNYANSVGYSTNAYSITRFATIENAAAAFYEANLSWEFANSVAYNAAAGFAFANGVNTFAYGVASNAKSAFDNSNGAFTVANSSYNYANTLSALIGGGGFFNSTLLSFPTGDYGSGEAYLVDLMDSFGVALEENYDCMDPSGRYSLVDLGVLT